MRLSEYLESNGISHADFAKQIGAKSRATVYRYLSGVRKFPSRKMMDKIIQVTCGQVTISDFYHEHTAKRPTSKKART